MGQENGKVSQRKMELNLERCLVGSQLKKGEEGRENFREQTVDAQRHEHIPGRCDVQDDGGRLAKREAGNGSGWKQEEGRAYEGLCMSC